MPKRKNEASNFNGLPFKEITTRLGPDELVKRLKACLNYIEGVNELPTTSIQSFIDLSYTLISHSIKDHKSKDVKLLAACILIKVHQLLNLESPTNEESLKEMCELFISQLDHVKKSSSPLYNWAFTLLELLASTKFFVCCHVLEKQDILVDLIQKIYTIINHDQTSQVHHYLLDIATGVIQAAEHLPDQLLDAILLPVVEESDTSVVYDFAQHLIKRSSQYLQPFIQTVSNESNHVL
jgi:sister-chromatid-cohesion protein PDS5